MAAEDTKSKIINATGELASELGLDNVSTRAIAQRSGENIGSIHYHFGGKDGLLKAVVREAMHGGKHEDTLNDLLDSERAPTPEVLSGAVRRIVTDEISDLFRSDRPDWHTQVIYQLLQRDDDLYEMFRREVLDPSMDSIGRVFELINPALDREEVFLYTVLMRMPIFSHANNMKAMQKRLGVTHYSEEYLQKMENLLVKQAQRLLDLPED